MRHSCLLNILFSKFCWMITVHHEVSQILQIVSGDVAAGKPLQNSAQLVPGQILANINFLLL